MRMALGASRRAVLQLILSNGARLAAAGILCGIIGAFAVTRVVTSLLYNVSASDPFSLLSACLKAGKAKQSEHEDDDRNHHFHHEKARFSWNVTRLHGQAPI